MGATVSNKFDTWTGGWVNRFAMNRFSAGADLLYNFTKSPYLPGSSEQKIHALTLQNIYVGYQFRLQGMQGLEVYADARNLAQHADYYYKIGGTNKYYGLGFKASL